MIADKILHVSSFVFFFIAIDKLFPSILETSLSKVGQFTYVEIPPLKDLARGKIYETLVGILIRAHVSTVPPLGMLPL